ncbi:hypothetical protein Tco_0650319 [Tanacetum coccineum]
MCFDLIGDVDPTDEDGYIGMGNSIGVSTSLGGEIFSGGNKSRESNIGDSDNTGDGGKIVGGAIRACGGIGERASEAKRSLVKSSEKLGEVFPGEAGKTGSLYPKTYWELLPKEILGATTQRDTGSYYPKRYWELLPKEILGAITQRDTGSYYPKRYWELLPKEILGCLMGKWSSLQGGDGGACKLLGWLLGDVIEVLEVLGCLKMGKKEEKDSRVVMCFDLIGDVDPTDEDGDIGMGDSTGVTTYLGGEIFSGGNKSQESNIGDSDNTGDGGKIVGGAIRACGGIDIMGATTQRDIGSYYPKRYWELLTKEILRAITQRDTRSYYLKRDWDILWENGGNLGNNKSG